MDLADRDSMPSKRKHCQQRAGRWRGKCLWGSHSVASHQAVIRNALHLVPTNHWLYCLRVPKHVRCPPYPRAPSPSSLSVSLPLSPSFHLPHPDNSGRRGRILRSKCCSEDVGDVVPESPCLCTPLHFCWDVVS